MDRNAINRQLESLIVERNDVMYELYGPSVAHLDWDTFSEEEQEKELGYWEPPDESNVRVLEQELDELSDEIKRLNSRLGR